MKLYDEIDPEQYEMRHKSRPRESYLYGHYYPLIVAAIENYCKGKSVLDLGCGTGVYTNLIAKYGQVLGLDVSKRILKYAKSKYPDLSFVFGDAHSILLKDESIDVVVSIGLFEYVKRATVLKEINRVLRLNGICIIACPNKYSAVRMPVKIIDKILNKEYSCKEPSYREMLKLFEQEGFKVIESKMDDGLIWLPYFLDKFIGERIYFFIERFFKIFSRNPFSNVMLFVIRKIKKI